eukprot:360863-Chlamydomonas_euryale.AAC.7
MDLRLQLKQTEDRAEAMREETIEAIKRYAREVWKVWGVESMGSARGRFWVCQRCWRACQLSLGGEQRPQAIDVQSGRCGKCDQGDWSCVWDAKSLESMGSGWAATGVLGGGGAAAHARGHENISER